MADKVPNATFIPLGQGDFDPDEAKERTKRLKEKWTLSEVPSFEVWAATTCFDPREKDGGALFQYLMCRNLRAHDGDDRKVDVESVPSKQLTFWNPDAKKRSPLLKPLTTLTGIYVPKASVMQYEDEPPVGGLPLQILANNRPPFKGIGQSGTELTDQLRPVLGSRAGGRAAWWASCGFDPQGYDRCKGTARNERQLWGTAGDGQLKVKLDEDCQYMGPRIAMYYGLYLYKNASSKEYNWTMKDDTYTIRMRCPNPTYDENGATLTCEVELFGGNTDYSDVTFIRFPKWQQTLCYDVLAALKKDNQKKTGRGKAAGKVTDDRVVSKMLGWAGPSAQFTPGDPMKATKSEEEAPPEAQVFRVTNPNFAKVHTHLHGIMTKTTQFKGRFYDVTQDKYFKEPDGSIDAAGGLMFGWSFPMAMWLYPHDPAAKAYLVDPTYLDDLNKEPFLYQPWPAWRSKEHAHFFAFETVRRKPNQIIPLVCSLWPLPPPMNDYEQRRKCALNRKPWKSCDDTDDATLINCFTAESSQVVTSEAKTVKEVDTVVPEGLAAVPQSRDDGDPVEDNDYTGGQDEDTRLENREILELTDKTDESSLVVSLLSTGITVDDDNTSVAIDKAIKSKDLKAVKEIHAIEPGAPKPWTKAGNDHFKAYDLVAWGPSDVYMQPRHIFEFGTAMKDKQVKEYKQKYGNLANTINPLDGKSYKIAHVLNEVGVEKRLKNGKLIINQSITAYKEKGLEKHERELFRQQMRRILNIYLDDSPLGGIKKGHGIVITSAEKKRGMENGMYVPKGPDKYSCPKVVYEKKGNQLLPAVFTLTAALKKELEQHEFMRTSKDGDDLTSKFPDVLLDKINSTMTVLQWLQTPWHYEYLPFIRMNSVFKDGETYSNGCTRCARPFYEYKHYYAPHTNTEKAVRHWPTMYWRGGGMAKHDYCQAPLPFHEERFWSSEEVLQTGIVPVDEDVLGNEDERRNEESGKGFHNWPTHHFLLGFQEVTRGGKKQVVKCPVGSAPTGCSPLDDEWNKRKGDTKSELMTAYKKKHPFTFRKYLNHMYDPKREDEIDLHLKQGSVRSRHAKVCYGMCQYKLMRSIKYGNCCRDCMSVLDYAGGLYARTGDANTAAQNLAGDKTKKAPSTNAETWWASIKELPKDFDPWFLYIFTTKGRDGNPGASRKATYEAYKKHYRPDYRNVIDEASGKLNQVKALFKAQMKEPGAEPKKTKLEDLAMEYERHLEIAQKYLPNKCANITKTKLYNPPDITIQKTWDKTPQNWKTQDNRAAQGAATVCTELVEWLDKVYAPHSQGTRNAPDFQMIAPSKDPFKLAFDRVQDRGVNRALRDMLYDVTAMYGQREKEVDKQRITFDPEMMRKEYRGNDKLVISQLVLPGDVTRVVGGGQLPVDEANKMREKFVIRAKDGVQPPRGDGSYYEQRTFDSDNSDWRGDDYAKTKNLQVQERTLQQSRLFITYSLHRRVFSEFEARAVMEQMADGVRKLFGDDHELCQIVLFGVKLQSQENKKDDTVSKKQYTHITKPNKSDTLFYGDVEGNSYIYDTYMTHVESVTVDAGVEIGPRYHHPHFHCLVTFNHYSYIHIDTSRLKSVLEQYFKGTHPVYTTQYQLTDGRGLHFYTDNENPYIDIRVYPSDNWADVIAAYVRKGADRQGMMALRARTGDTSVLA